MQDNQATGPQAAKDGVSHHKTETVTTDHEKIVAAFTPLVEALTPSVEAWRTTDLEKVKVTEAQVTWRQMIASATVVGVVSAVVFLAWAAINNGQAATAEKIVIGLLAFLGGLGVRR